jgi:hypothetical protein
MVGNRWLISMREMGNSEVGGGGIGREDGEFRREGWGNFAESNRIYVPHKFEFLTNKILQNIPLLVRKLPNSLGRKGKICRVEMNVAGFVGGF